VTTDYQENLRRDDIDVVDIVTSRDNRQELSSATLEAGKHCLVEKPVCHNYAGTWRAHQLAESKNLKTKVGLTFRYAPAMQYMYELVQQGFIGRPFIFNGYEQNSQFIDAAKPMRVGSLEGYGAPVTDISLWMVESKISSVAGILKNFIPQRRSAGADWVRCSTATWCITFCRRSTAEARPTRATSRRAPACRS
jgi:predicted dehydrogenase